jgi:hypothetical protein
VAPVTLDGAAEQEQAGAVFEVSFSATGDDAQLMREAEKVAASTGRPTAAHGPGRVAQKTLVARLQGARDM